MDDAEGGVAAPHRVGDDAQGEQVVDLVDADLLPLELLVDRVGAFDAAFDFGGNALAAELVGHRLLDLDEELFVGVAAGFDGADNLFPGVGVEVLEGQVLEFAAHFSHSQAVCDGSVDLNGLARDAFAALAVEIAERAHVVDAVGQLDQHDADVLDHGEEHFAKALGLPVLGREEVEFAELGDAVHAAGHVDAELLAHLVSGDAGVLHHVVQQAGLHADHIHTHFGEDMGDQDGVEHVGLARIAGLALVVAAGEAVGLFEGCEVLFGPVFTQLGFELAIELFHRVGRLDGRLNIGNAGWLGGHRTLDCRTTADSNGKKAGERLSAACLSILRGTSDYLASLTMPPVFWAFFSAFSFLAARAFCTHASATSVSFLYSSAVSMRSARSRISRFM